MKLLHIDSSILGAHSVSRKLSAAAVAKLRNEHPGIEVAYRDLAAQHVPHLSGAVLAAGATPPEQHSAELKQDVSLGAEVLDQFLSSDIVVIGTPMYNFTVPTQLKAWIDRVLIAGKTFRYTEKGPEGLAGGKRVIVAVSRGGAYGAGSPAAPFDQQEPYLRTVFGFIGIPNVEFIRAEGLAVGPEQKEKAIAAAEQEIALLKAA